jgi:hypothetical protein
MCGIKLQEQRGGFGRCQIIDGDNLEIVARRFDQGPQHIAANPPKSIYRDLFHYRQP